MNGSRRHIEKVWSLPYQLKLHFAGRDGAPERRDIKPVLRYEGQDKVLAPLKVDHYSDKLVIITLPEHLSKFGLGRYELLLHTQCCRECDKVLLEFRGDCKVTRVEGQPVEERKDVRY